MLNKIISGLKHFVANTKELVDTNPKGTANKALVRAAAERIAKRFNWTIEPGDTLGAKTYVDVPYVSVDGQVLFYFVDLQKKSGMRKISTAATILHKQFAKELDNPTICTVEFYISDRALALKLV
jgi:hypothetical protein